MTVLDFAPLLEAIRSVGDAARDALAALNVLIARLDMEQIYTRYAIENMDIAESDIKRIDLTGPIPVVVLKNRRRIPIERKT